MKARTSVIDTWVGLLLLIALVGAASADPGDSRFPPCRFGECLALANRISRVDVELQFKYQAFSTNGTFEHLVGMVVTIPDQGTFHLREIARPGSSAHLMWIHLVGSEAVGAVHIEVRLPSGGAATVGVCYTTPAPQCDVKVDLDLLTSSPFPGPTGETDYALAEGRYSVRVVYADGSRRRLVFNTGVY